ncbi:putative baseplate assembly protein [Variovorax sp. J22R24]|uniref:putative baseplate assembly protein n=1 Tax=Variovorax gracilis TaxID=3053502 RepID=UPI002577521A|nr:putative baseplate assembly protein [Variovorax sp. J22R24]MDM0109295.1 putative baseplate assembly protein [Variovorax sp. J22R24]
MSSDDKHLDGCHCCEDLAEPGDIHNAPGLPALAWRVDTQPGFYQRMLARLPLWGLPGQPASAPRPLGLLRTRESDDAAIALVDASACVADVLTFYQERIANEGFLRTATERRSVLELARAVGYELRPGVAASVHLVFTVEDAPGAPGVCAIAAGAPVQSVPPQGKLPQVFETGEPIVARAEWNALRPRQTRPADLAVLEVDGTQRLALLYPKGGLPGDTVGLHQDLSSGNLFRLDPDLPVEAKVDAQEVARIYLSDQASGLQAGELLLFVGKKGLQLKHLVLRALEVEDEPALRRVRVALEPLPDPKKPAAPPMLIWLVPTLSMFHVGYAQAQIEVVPFTQTDLGPAVTTKSWKENELQAMIAIQGWSTTQLVQAVTASVQPPATPNSPEAGAFSFTQRLGFFGHNAPKWGSLPKENLRDSTIYKDGWDDQDPVTNPTGTLDASRSIWTDSQGKPNMESLVMPPCHALLERPVPKLAPGSWMVFDAPNEKATAYALFDAREVSRADYGLSARATALRLADSNGQPMAQAPTEEFLFRDTTAHVVSRRQPLVELPIETPIETGSKRIELSTMVMGLARGQALAFVGQRGDLAGVDAAEIALVDEVEHSAGRSTLVLQKALLYSYRRDSLLIHANVARATHGESVQEVLGNGDATQSFQRFMLRKPPTTHLSAASASGAKSTLELRVNGLLWTERPSLYGAAPDEHVFTTRIDNEARMQVLFGDGRSGARLPSGQMNVQARYRSGIGPDGEVAAGTLTLLRAMPLGLRGVSNPLPASGAQGPEKLDDARRNAPLTLLAFERVVSLSDYQDFARAFPGIGKARADLVWAEGVSRVLLSVAGATGGLPGDEVMDNLRKAIAGLSDPSQAFVLGAAVLRYFRCSARVAIDPRYEADTVLAACRTKLQAAFGFDARDLAQSVTAAELLALLHQVPGVVAVDLEVLQPYGEAATAGGGAQAVPTFGARWDPVTKMRPAELMLLNPAALELVKATL